LSSSRGIARERAVRRLLEDDGWWVCRAAGSLGDADLVALRASSALVHPRALMIEVKSTHRGAFHSFGPADRSALLEAAERAGAEAWLCWWPPHGQPQWIPSRGWPNHNRTGEEREDGGSKP